MGYDTIASQRDSPGPSAAQGDPQGMTNVVVSKFITHGVPDLQICSLQPLLLIVKQSCCLFPLCTQMSLRDPQSWLHCPPNNRAFFLHCWRVTKKNLRPFQEPCHCHQCSWDPPHQAVKRLCCHLIWVNHRPALFLCQLFLLWTLPCVFPLIQWCCWVPAQMALLWPLQSQRISCILSLLFRPCLLVHPQMPHPQLHTLALPLLWLCFQVAQMNGWVVVMPSLHQVCIILIPTSFMGIPAACMGGSIPMTPHYSATKWCSWIWEGLHCIWMTGSYLWTFIWVLVFLGLFQIEAHQWKLLLLSLAPSLALLPHEVLLGFHSCSCFLDEVHLSCCPHFLVFVICLHSSCHLCHSCTCLESLLFMHNITNWSDWMISTQCITCTQPVHVSHHRREGKASTSMWQQHYWWHI